MSDHTHSPIVSNLPPDTPGPHRSRLGLIAVIATFGGLLFGYDTGVINGALEPMKTDLGMSAQIEGFVVSILIFGAALGAIIGGKLSDIRGRRENILMLAVIFAVGTLGCVFAPSWEVLAVFRFILGLAVGGASATVPVYLSEISPAERRGSLVTRNEVMIVSGQFAAFIINFIIFRVAGENPDVWRYMLAVAVLPGLRPVLRHAPDAGEPTLAGLQGTRRRSPGGAQAGALPRAGRGRDGRGPPARRGGEGLPDRRRLRPRRPLDPTADLHRCRPGRVPAVHRHQLGHVLRHPAAAGRRFLQHRRHRRQHAERPVQRPRHHRRPALDEPHRPAQDAPRRLHPDDDLPPSGRAVGSAATRRHREGHTSS